MMKLLRQILFVSFVALCGCEAVVDFPISTNTPGLPVIEAILTDKLEPQYVRVSISVPVSDSSSCKPIETAKVCIYSNNGDTVHFVYAVNGWYKSMPFGALPGLKYTLRVAIDSVVYLSSDQIIEMNGIDSIYYKYQQQSVDYGQGYFVYIDAGLTDSENIRYYQINAFKNNNLLTYGSELWIFNDKYLKEIKAIKLPLAFSESDTVVIELNSISKEVFEYYFSLTNEIFFTNITDIGYNSNPPNMFTPEALGYFQVSAVSSKTIIIK